MNIKIVKDCIYGHIEIPELCSKFIDVPEFQRLRRIKQLGTTHYAYPSATHTRFEHSIGVMYMAGKLCDRIRVFKNITPRQKDLIQLAALYHDIGHFSFSHLFDHFLEHYENKENIFKYINHEDRSVYFVKKVNQRLKLLTEEEMEFVCNCILGYVPEGQPHYLYQIVCNKECGIDVDKMDYLKRDSYHTGFQDFQTDYIISGLVIDKSHIAFKKKVKEDLTDLFRTRTRMFNNVYQHHSVLKVNKLYYCAMKKLGNCLFYYGENTDDYNIETLIRTLQPEIMEKLDTRDLDHYCDICKDYSTKKIITTSGKIEDVLFV